MERGNARVPHITHIGTSRQMTAPESSRKEYLALAGMLRGHAYRRSRRPHSSSRRGKFFAGCVPFSLPQEHPGCQHVVPDPNILTSRRIDSLEKKYIILDA